MTATETGEMIRREMGEDGVCVLTFDRPESGANIFDAATMDSLREHLDAIENDASLNGVIVTSAKKSIFIAGADLQTLLRQAQTGELRAFIAEGQRVFNRLAALKVPTVAAIHGACAGGGYEITLACDHRVASNDPATKIGLPETTLGLLPAWGGATRLPRLIGLGPAADVILKGKLHSADEALKIGLVDEVVAPDQLMAAARARLAKGKREMTTPPRVDVQVQAAKGHNPAPRRALDVMNAGLDLSVDESLKLELDGIVELAETEGTQNLIRNFFLGDKFRKGSSKTKHEKITHAAVIGAGVMGSGIAQWLSSRGVSVILRDVSAEQLDRGLGSIEKTYGDAVKRGLMSEEKATEGRARIVASSAGGEMRDVEIVIEAASEKVEIKNQIFADLAAQDSGDGDPRDEHVCAIDHGARRDHGQAGARDRPAFFQSGQPHEADRSRRRQGDGARDSGAHAGLHAADRKAAGRRAGQPWLPRQSRPLPIPARCRGAVRARRRCEGDG